MAKSVFESHKRRKERINTFKDASNLIIDCALMGVVLTSPYAGHFVLGALKEHLAKKHKLKQKEISSRSLSQAIYYLRDRKIINIETKGDKTKITLSEKGKKKKLEHDWNKLKLDKPPKWDGKWRMLMFDIPEEARTVRNNLRLKLRQLGFIQFQQSVWICPYPCEDEIDFAGEFLHIRSYLNLITANIENDKPLRDKFNL